jgi:23S rRNA (cytosine1962-C5)-methyltransferase
MVSWAKENLALSGLADRPVRFINDDVIKFIQREARRGHKYDGIIMDPPSYGRGPKGEVWKIEDELYRLIEECLGILSDKPVFFLVNSYTTGFSPTVVGNILKSTVGNKYSGVITSGEVGLPVKKSGLILPCGIFGRWEEKLLDRP